MKQRKRLSTLDAVSDALCSVLDAVADTLGLDRDMVFKVLVIVALSLLSWVLALLLAYGAWIVLDWAVDTAERLLS